MTLILYHQPVHRHKAVELYVPAPRVSARLRGLGVKDHDLCRVRAGPKFWHRMEAAALNFCY